MKTTIRASGGVFATKSHRFWSVEDGEWIAAAELQLGTVALLASGETEKIVAISSKATAEATYNLTVERRHNYFVGKSGWLVHNTSGFMNQFRRPTIIYEVFDPTLPFGQDTVYVGKTVQSLDKRFNQHLNSDPKKTHWKPNRYQIREVDSGNWTEFETATWEKHVLDKNGGKSNPRIENAKDPVSQKNTTLSRS